MSHKCVWDCYYPTFQGGEQVYPMIPYGVYRQIFDFFFLDKTIISVIIVRSSIGVWVYGCKSLILQDLHLCGDIWPYAAIQSSSHYPAPVISIKNAV